MFKVNFYLENDSIECLKKNKIIGHGDNAYFIQMYEDKLDIEINGKHLFKDIAGLDEPINNSLPWFFDNLLKSAFDIFENKNTKVEFLGSYFELGFENLDNLIKITLINKKDGTKIEIAEDGKSELINEIKNEVNRFVEKITEINKDVIFNSFMIDLNRKISKLLKS